MKTNTCGAPRRVASGSTFRFVFSLFLCNLHLSTIILYWENVLYCVQRLANSVFFQVRAEDGLNKSEITNLEPQIFFHGENAKRELKN